MLGFVAVPPAQFILKYRLHPRPADAVPCPVQTELIILICQLTATQLSGKTHHLT